MSEGVIARASELAAIEGFLSEASDGPSAFLLEGPAGIGKTVLWEAGRASADRSRDHGPHDHPHPVRVGDPAGRLLGPVRGVGDELLDALPAPQRRALDVALLRTDPDEAERRRPTGGRWPSGRRRCSAPWPLAGRSCWRSTTCSGWTTARRRCSRSRSGAWRMRPVAVLLALRDQLPAAGAARDRDGRAALRAVHPGAAPPGGDPPPLRRSSRPPLLPAHAGQDRGGLRGQPVLRAGARPRADPLGGGDRPGQPLPVPETLDALTQERIASMPAPTREALTVAALTPEPSLEVLARAGIDDPARLAGAGRPRRRRRRRGRDRAVHPSAAGIDRPRPVGSPRSSEGVHGRLAGAVTSEEARARHAGLAAAEPDDEVARMLDDAAQRVRSRGAPAAAAELFELAASLTPPEQTSERWRRRFDSARSLFDAGESQVARRAAGGADRGARARPGAGAFAPAPRTGRRPVRELPRGAGVRDRRH